MPITVDVLDLKDVEPESLLQPNSALTVFIMSTYTDGQPPENSKWFCSWLEDTRYDFRVSKTALSHLRFAVYGLGHSVYGQNFNKVGKNVDTWLRGLGARAALPIGLGDEDDSKLRLILY